MQSLWSELKDSLEAGRAEVSVGAPGSERRIQRKKPRRVGTSPGFPSCEAVAGVKGRCLAPDTWVERGQPLTPPAKRRPFIDWAAYHNAQGSRTQARPPNCL